MPAVMVTRVHSSVEASNAADFKATPAAGANGTVDVIGAVTIDAITDAGADVNVNAMSDVTTDAITDVGADVQRRRRRRCAQHRCQRRGVQLRHWKLQCSARGMRVAVTMPIEPLLCRLQRRRRR